MEYNSPGNSSKHKAIFFSLLHSSILYWFDYYHIKFTFYSHSVHTHNKVHTISQNNRYEIWVFKSTCLISRMSYLSTSLTSSDISNANWSVFLVNYCQGIYEVKNITIHSNVTWCTYFFTDIFVYFKFDTSTTT